MTLEDPLNGRIWRGGGGGVQVRHGLIADETKTVILKATFL